MSELTSRPAGGGGVLVVEDEALVAFYLEDTLDDLGYRCCGIADCAEEALSLAEAQRPVLALVDVGLRGSRDGVAVATELKERGIGVVFLTGASDPETRYRIEAVGALGILAKPCNPRDIAVMLESVHRTCAEQ